MTRPESNLVLAVHPNSRGYGWVVFENPHLLVDWGIARTQGDDNASQLLRFEHILKKYEPTVLVLEEFEGGVRRADRVQRLCRTMLRRAESLAMETPIYSREAIRLCFASVGAASRYEIALAIAGQLDALSHRLPRRRKRWMVEDHRQALFDAAALALTYFTTMGKT